MTTEQKIIAAIDGHYERVNSKSLQKQIRDLFLSGGSGGSGETGGGTLGPIDDVVLEENIKIIVENADGLGKVDYAAIKEAIKLETLDAIEFPEVPEFPEIPEIPTVDIHKADLVNATVETNTAGVELLGVKNNGFVKTPYPTGGGGTEQTVVQNVSQIANITPNGIIHNIDFSGFTSGSKFVAPATGWLYAGGEGYISINALDADGNAKISSNNDRNAKGGVFAYIPVTKGDSCQIFFDANIVVLHVVEVTTAGLFVVNDVLCDIAITEVGEIENALKYDASEYDELYVTIYYPNNVEYNNNKIQTISIKNGDTASFCDHGATTGSDWFMLLNIKVKGKNVEVKTLNSVRERDWNLLIEGKKYTKIEEVSPLVIKDENLIYEGDFKTKGNYQTDVNINEYDKVTCVLYANFASGLACIGSFVVNTHDTTKRINMLYGSSTSGIEFVADFGTENSINVLGIAFRSITPSTITMKMYGEKTVNVSDITPNLVIDKNVLLVTHACETLDSITLSESWRNFDELRIELIQIATNTTVRRTETINVSSFGGDVTGIPCAILNHVSTGNEVKDYLNIFFKSDTEIKTDFVEDLASQNVRMYFNIYGIKYAKVEDIISRLKSENVLSDNRVSTASYMLSDSLVDEHSIKNGKTVYREVIEVKEDITTGKVLCTIPGIKSLINVSGGAGDGKYYVPVGYNDTKTHFMVYLDGEDVVCSVRGISPKEATVIVEYLKE